MSKKKETIPNDIPEDIRGVIQKCWKDGPSERITLERILKIIGTNKSELRVISDDNKLLGTENLSEPQNSKKNNEISYEVSQSMNFDIDRFDNMSKDNSQEQSSTQVQIQVPPK